MRFSAPIYQLKRRAKQMARAENIPLHLALDRIAEAEGLAGWSLLARQRSDDRAQLSLLPGLVAGDMLLIAARPAHGKTRLGLRLLLDAAAEGQRAVLYTLEYCDEEAQAQLRRMGGRSFVRLPEVVTSEDICAERIIRDLSGAAPGTVAVIDYLQILDQHRSKPPLSEQITALKEFARESGVIFGFISQIDRGFDPERKAVPDVSDIRLPNPIAGRSFSKACFLHGGTVRLENVA